MKLLVSALAAIVFASSAVAVPAVSTPVSQAFIQQNAVPGVFNYDTSKLPKWRAALSRVVSGAGKASVLFYGDSTTRCWGGGNSGTFLIVGAGPLCIPAKLTALFNGSGVPASDDFVFGNGLVGNGVTDFVTYDARFSFGSGWSVAGIGNSLGAGAFTNSANTTAMTFTPNFNVDTCAIFYAQSAGNGTAVVSDSGGTFATNGTFSTSGTAQVASITVGRATPSRLPISIARNGTGSALYILGLNCTDSTTPRVSFAHSATAGWASSNYTAIASWSVNSNPCSVPADLIVLDLGLNDRNAAVSASVYQTQMQTIITNAKACGADVLLVRYPPPNPATWSNSALEPVYASALYALATSNGLPLIDLTYRFGGSYAAMPPGESYDGVHLTKTGYADKAMALFSILRPQ